MRSREGCIKIIDAASIAISLPEPIANPTVAALKARVSLTPLQEGNIPIAGRTNIIADEDGYVENVKINIAYSKEAENYIKQIAKGVTQEVTECLGDFNTHFDQNTKSLVRSHQGDAPHLRQLINDKINPLHQVHSQQSTFDADVQHIEDALKIFDPASAEKFLRLRNQRKFLLRLKSKESTVSLALNKGGVLHELITSANKLSKPPISGTVNTTLTLNGEIIGTSDIVKALLGRDNISMLNAYATHSLLIDHNVDKPGLSMALAAPQWIVRGKKNISLRGRDGREIRPHQAPDAEHGQPGEPGQSGGNFYGLADEIFGGAGLTINVSGGTGGSGQRGGNGTKGQDGKEGSREDIEKVREAAQRSQETQDRSWCAWPFTANTAQHIVLQSGELATPGGDAGAGGQGGYGGRAGSIKVEKYERGKYYPLPTGGHSIEREGQDGSNGLPGLAGKGGLNRDVYSGEFIRKTSSWWDWGTRVAADASAGAAAGAVTIAKVASVASWLGSAGGPVGSAVSYCGVVGAGALIGAVGGAITPMIGTGIDKKFCWEKEPFKMDRSERALDGKVPQFVNSHGRRPSEEALTINIPAFRTTWKDSIKE